MRTHSVRVVFFSVEKANLNFLKTFKSCAALLKGRCHDNKIFVCSSTMMVISCFVYTQKNNYTSMGFFYIWGVPVPLFLRYENLNRNSYTPFIWGSRTPMVLFTHILVNVPSRFTVPCKFGVSLTNRVVSLPEKSESVVIELLWQHVFLLLVTEKQVPVTCINS